MAAPPSAVPTKRPRLQLSSKPKRAAAQIRQVVPPPQLPSVSRCERCGEDISPLPHDERVRHLSACIEMERAAAERLGVVAQHEAPPQLQDEPTPAAEERRSDSIIVVEDVADTPPAVPPPPSPPQPAPHDLTEQEVVEVVPRAKAAEPTRGRPSLWRLAAELRPGEYTSGGPFSKLELVQVATSSQPSEEGLTCASCTLSIRVSVGAHWDSRGDVLCHSCASVAGVLDPSLRKVAAARERSRAAEVVAAAELEAAAAVAAAEEEEIAIDLAAAIRHLKRAALKGGNDELQSMMSEHGWLLSEVAARGVLDAYVEVEGLLVQAEEARAPEGESDGDGSDELRIMDEMVRRWEAPIPMMLLRALDRARRDAAEHLGTLCEEVRQLRLRCESSFVAQGLRLP